MRNDRMLGMRSGNEGYYEEKDVAGQWLRQHRAKKIQAKAEKTRAKADRKERLDQRDYL